MKTNFTRFRYVLAAVLCCLVSVGVWGQTTVEQSTFTATSANSLNKDTNVSYTTDKGGGTTAPAINNGEIRLYQRSDGTGGGTITISVAENCVLNSVTIGSSMTTKIAYTLNSETKKSTTSNLAANATFTVSDQTASSITFHCMGTNSSSRLYVNFLSVTYTKEAATFVEIPTFSPESGSEFSGSLDVTLACATDGAAIRYTTDGTTPSASSTLYTASFSITETTTVKAIAIKNGLDNSEVAEATYTKVLPTPNFAYSTGSVTANLGEIFTAPTLTYNSNSDLSALNISYVSSNSNVATVDIATGEVQILSDGTTTITASVEATSTHQAAQTSYELTVIDPNSIFTILDFANEDWGFASDYNTSPSTATYNNMTCSYLNGKMVTSGAKYFIFKTGGYLTLPTFSDKIVKSIELTTSSGIGSSVKVDLYAGEQLVSENITIGEKNKTFIFDIDPKFQESNVLYKFVATTGNAQVTNINIKSKKAGAVSTIDPSTKIMTLSGSWAATDLSTLDLTDPTITGIDMTGITIPVDAPALTPANPNSLIYVANAATYPNSWKNVVEATDALGIYLTDGSNFHNVKEFSATEATYTRTFAKGWNTFSLPFDATITEGDVVEEFDTKTETSIKFKTATSIKANQAYLINIAADNTEKAFTGTGVVPVTASTGDTFKSNFTKLTGTDAQGKYILVIQGGKEVFAPASEKATVAAFRGYLDLASGPAPAPKYTIEHDGGATNIDDANAESGMKIYSENGALVIYTNEIQNVQIYGLDGLMVRNIQLSEGNNTINGLAKGIYLINNQKAIVK